MGAGQLREQCPDGERKDDFSNRICNAFSALVDKALADGEELLVILAHGGTQMAAMERYALPRRDYMRGAAPTRAAMCWTPPTGPRSASSTS